MLDLRQAMLDPTSVFKTPDEVLCSQELSREEKINILKRWDYDARELEVAEEENMQGADPDMLEFILHALNALGESPCQEHSAPTKQGGE